MQNEPLFIHKTPKYYAERYPAYSRKEIVVPVDPKYLASSILTKMAEGDSILVPQCWIKVFFDPRHYATIDGQHQHYKRGGPLRAVAQEEGEYYRVWRVSPNFRYAVAPETGRAQIDLYDYRYRERYPYPAISRGAGVASDDFGSVREERDRADCGGGVHSVATGAWLFEVQGDPYDNGEGPHVSGESDSWQ